MLSKYRSVSWSELYRLCPYKRPWWDNMLCLVSQHSGDGQMELSGANSSLNMPSFKQFASSLQTRVPPHFWHVTGFFNFTNLVKKFAAWCFLGKGEQMSIYPTQGTKDRPKECFLSNLPCWAEESLTGLLVTGLASASLPSPKGCIPEA